MVAVCLGRAEGGSKTHVLGVVLAQLHSQLQRCCWLRVLWAELGAEEHLGVAQTRVVAQRAAAGKELVWPEMEERGLWVWTASKQAVCGWTRWSDCWKYCTCNDATQKMCWCCFSLAVDEICSSTPSNCVTVQRPQPAHKNKNLTM